jgi:hypothetical protein
MGERPDVPGILQTMPRLPVTLPGSAGLGRHRLEA